MPHRSFIAPAFAIGASAALLSFSSPAQAGGFTIAGEAGPTTVLNKAGNDDFGKWGFGAAARIGYMIGIPLLRITPEVKLGYVAPGEPHAFLGVGGARLNLFKLVSPVVFAHAGGVAGDVNGFLWDAGLGLDIGLVKFLDFGVFASYNQVPKAKFKRVDYESGNWQWLHFGGQVALHF